MNLFEFGLFLAAVIGVVLCSSELGRLFAIPEALAVLAMVGVLAVVLRLFTRIRPRALLYFSSLAVAVCLVSLVLAKTIGLREATFMTPVSTGLILVVIRGAVLVRRRLRAPNENDSYA